MPFILVVNKVDLKNQWEVDDAALRTPRDEGWPVIYASAKTGEGVEELFETLSRKMLIQP